MAETTLYGVTALRYHDAQVAEALMGLIDEDTGEWALPPSPTRAVEVVDRLVEGDIVIAMFPGRVGRLIPGPALKVEVDAEGGERLALAEEEPGRRLRDLPRF